MVHRITHRIPPCCVISLGLGIIQRTNGGLHSECEYSSSLPELKTSPNGHKIGYFARSYLHGPHSIIDLQHTRRKVHWVDGYTSDDASSSGLVSDLDDTDSESEYGDDAAEVKEGAWNSRGNEAELDGPVLDFTVIKPRPQNHHSPSTFISKLPIPVHLGTLFNSISLPNVIYKSITSLALTVLFPARHISTCISSLCSFLIRPYSYFTLRIHKFHLLLRHALFGAPPSPYDTYSSRDDEQKRYWDSIKPWTGRMKGFDARFNTQSSSTHIMSSSASSDDGFPYHEDTIPVISSYQPALPPLTVRRHSVEHRLEEEEEDYHYLSVKTFRKWYGMVYPERKKPTPSQAARMLHTYSTQDKKEIRRMSKLKLKKRDSGGNEYKKQWEDYLSKKFARGPELVVVFEDEKV
ncbi:hypothetical protein VKT23_017468 [Stygiomarasmius scandens]|uniref:Uncharacterized protein n=1 Tax=Marasmiellus scandens TaxID=2682957 RepID=A0ABR1IW65_9AGAR